MLHAPALPDDPFNAATGELNEWRGRCLSIFAAAETAMTEALIAWRASDVTHLIGARAQMPSAMLEARPGGAKALTALAAFRAHDALRRLAIVQEAASDLPRHLPAESAPSA